jgi:uncharacterized coiled-coil DUF342 family protein
MSGKVTISQQVAALRVEIQQRKVKAGMSRSQAEYDIARLEAAVATLEWLQTNEQLIKGALGA